MSDLLIQEIGNGGDLVFTGFDLAVIDGFENMPYLGMFGGNIKESTQVTRPAAVQAFDFWANHLFMLNQPEIQLNSETERVLRNVALTSSGRELIQQAVNTDLNFMRAFASVSVVVSIVDIDRVQIDIKIKELNSKNSNEFVYIWSATNLELSGPLSVNGTGQGIALNNILNFSL